MHIVSDPVLPAEEFAYVLRTMIVPIVCIVATVTAITVVIVILLNKKKHK